VRGAAWIVLLVSIGLAVASCAQTRTTEVPAAPIDPTRMPHEVHGAIACGDCHRAGERPGADDHAPCDGGQCHARQFLAAPTLFCQVCHTEVVAQPTLQAPLKPYPSVDAYQLMPSTFSHQVHLDQGRMEQRVGFHVACGDCHTRNATLARPDHATCARCHAPEVRLAGAPDMDACRDCHQGGMRERTASRLMTGDLRPFDHDRHRSDRKSKPIRCDTCHTGTAKAGSLAELGAPRVESCVSCHDDVDRVPYDKRMRACETCHRQRAATLTAIAPRSHLPATERPLDHTIAFRRDHAEAAAASAARCAGCHTQMSGSPFQACDECHQTMLPANHRITWRELDHGLEAAADRETCATCHAPEICTACHAQRPRSHGMFGSYGVEHGRQARINVRPCLTCHPADPGVAASDGPVGIISCGDCHDTSALRGGP